MNVKELIEKLKEYDENMPVVISDHEFDDNYFHLDEIRSGNIEAAHFDNATHKYVSERVDAVIFD